MENKEKKETAADRELQAVQKFKRVFSGPDGEAALRHLIKQCHGLESVFHDNPQRMAFMEGKRSVVMDIIQILQIDEKKYMEILEDSRDELIEEQDLM